MQLKQKIEEGQDSMIIHTSDIIMQSYAEKLIPFSESYSSGEYVNWGKNNLEPNFLYELIKECNTHSTCINLKSDYVFGEGFDKYGDFIVNPEGDTLNDLLRRVAEDRVSLNTFSLEFIWNDGRTQIGKTYHIEPALLRAQKPNEDGEFQYYWFRNDWSPQHKSSKYNKPKKIKKWNPNDREEAVQVLFCAKKKPLTMFYSYPDYYACTKDILAAMAISTFDLANIENGFAPSYIVTFPKKATLEEKQQTIDLFKRQFQGPQRAGKAIFLWGESGQVPTITVLATNDNDKKFEGTRVSKEQEILKSHGVNALLLGAAKEGALGNRNEILQASEQFQTTIINKIQQDIEEEFHKFLPYMGITEKIRIKPFKILSKIDISIGESQILNVLDRQEIRSMIGIDAKILNPPASNPSAVETVPTNEIK